jgi:tetratricopeptide (TPR) repeat protein
VFNNIHQLDSHEERLPPTARVRVCQIKSILSGIQSDRFVSKVRAIYQSYLIIPTDTSTAIMKNSFLTGLTLATLVFATASSATAELAPQINSLTIKNIERSNTQERTNTQERSNTPERTNRRRPRVATNSQKSMEYVKLGWAAQKKGDKDKALSFYLKAVQTDRTNAYAFMAGGNLIGHNEDGITCMKAAAKLFRDQGNQEGVKVAEAWLAQGGEEAAE